MRYIVLILLALFPYVTWSQDKAKKKLSINFTINKNTKEDTMINTFGEKIIEEDSTCAIFYRVKIPVNYDYSSHQICTLNSLYDNHNHSEREKELLSKLIENIIYVGSNTYGKYKILDFKITPWWNIKDNLAPLELSLELNLTESRTKPRTVKNSIFTEELINTLVLNGDQEFPECNMINTTDSIPLSNMVTYAIITDSLLQDAFLPLKQWKNTKGVRTEIITTNYIQENYEGETLQLKIKNCLWDLNQNNGLEYVLLGGDDTVVPVLGCYANRNGIHENDLRKIITDMPTDLFYACFNGSFDWDANKNGVYGEFRVDSIDYNPSIVVTRLPVRSSSDVSSYINKLLNYEKNTNAHNWNYNIFLTGGKLLSVDRETGMSDGQIINDRLSRSYMMNWRGDVTKLYDTYSNIVNDTIHNVFSVNNFKYHLSEGYAFVNIVTHGSPGYYSLSDGFFYVVNSANTLINSSPSIVTTTACLTNAFDDPDCDPCISEAFIRNPNSNIIAYLGCSREGLGSMIIGGEGVSDEYNGQFYKQLFNRDNADKNFGRIVFQAKGRFSGQCVSDHIRWVHYGLNAIGDAEMPIYVKPPLEFENAYLENNDSTVQIYLGNTISNCKVTITSSSDFGETYIENFTIQDSLIVDAKPYDMTICLTKQGYVPRLFYVKKGELNIQNVTISSNTEYEERKIKIGRDVTSNRSEGDVVIQNGASVSVKADNTYVKSGVYVEKGAVLTIKNR